MKQFFRVLSVFLVLFIVLSLCSCKNKKDNNSNYEDEYFSIEGDNENSSDAGDNSATDNEKTNDNKKLPSNGNSANASVNADDYKAGKNSGSSFYRMDIPSRVNAYKLSNTYSKLKSNQKVKVAYFGGSVTSGTGSSSENTKSWRAITTKYISSLTSGKVTEVNAALGGTGSYLGAARFDNRIISENPDLVFIEFAINDYYNDISDNQIKANLEYMIWHLYAKNPYADIIITLVTNTDNLGKQYRSYLAHKEVADYYNIPIVDLGGELYNRNEGAVSKYFTDKVHPNDEGYKQYGEIMTDALKELFVEGSYSKHSMPSGRLFANGYNSLENVSPSSYIDDKWKHNSWFNDNNIEKTGSQFRYSTLKNQYPTYVAPKMSGATFTYSFSGNSFGILGTVKANSSITVVLDGNKKVIVGTSNEALLEYPLFENLSNGPHSVTITASRSLDEIPQVAIAAFVVTN